jgi:hypothetical protein
VSGNTAIIGAAYKNSYQGAAYVFNSPAVAITGSRRHAVFSVKETGTALLGF